MENKNIIIILVAIIVVLAAGMGFLLFDPFHAKEPTKVKITSDKEQYEGGELSIKLTDLNKTPLTKQKVGILITDKKGKLVANKSAITDSKGKAKCDLDLKKGKYVVNVIYGGNENYTGNNTTQKLTIKEEEVVEQAVQSSSYSSSQDIVREEDKVTPDGWNPNEHEVSRESIGNGYERVEYDDDYFRVVDKDGNIVNYGYS